MFFFQEDEHEVVWSRVSPVCWRWAFCLHSPNNAQHITKHKLSPTSWKTPPSPPPPLPYTPLPTHTHTYLHLHTHGYRERWILMLTDQKEIQHSAWSTTLRVKLHCKPQNWVKTQSLLRTQHLYYTQHHSYTIYIHICIYIHSTTYTIQSSIHTTYRSTRTPQRHYILYTMLYHTEHKRTLYTYVSINKILEAVMI